MIDAVHAVLGKPERADVGREKMTDATHKHPPTGIPHQLVLPPWRSVGCHHGKPNDVVQKRPSAPSDHLECDPWNPDTVDIALENRRHAVPPGRKHQHHPVTFENTF